MKKFLVALLALGLTSAPGWSQDKSLEAWQRLSKLQCLIEYFFMETGVYPLDLAEMEQVFRSKAPRAPRQVSIPIDPATNQPFKYQVEGNGRKYTLTVPDPSKYPNKISLGAVDWAFLSDLADLKRFQGIIQEMTNLLKGMATRCEMYAKDHGGQYPNAIDDLLPRYVTKLPSDPLTGKNLSYKKLLDGYVIACPNPEKYGLKTFQYHSSQGVQIEQAARAPGAKPGEPAKTPDAKTPDTKTPESKTPETKAPAPEPGPTNP